MANYFCIECFKTYDEEDCYGKNGKGFPPYNERGWGHAKEFCDCGGLLKVD